MATVLLLGGLRDKLGGAKFEIDAGCVGELLEGLAERGGARVAELFFAEPGAREREPSRDLRVLVNGRSVEHLAGLATPLAADDAVTVHLSGARGWPGG